MAAASLSTSLSTPPPPYRRMSEADRTTSSSACDFSAYCCLGTIHLKTATFMICLGYLLVLAHVWHELIPEWSVDPTKGQIDARLVTYVLVMAAVVVCALIGVHYENHVYIFPLVVMHFVCLAYTMLHLFFSSFGSSSGGRAMMLFVQWLMVLLAMAWLTTIVCSCFRLFRYFRIGTRCTDPNNNSSLPYNSPSSSPVVPMNGMGHRHPK